MTTLDLLGLFDVLESILIYTFLMFIINIYRKYGVFYASNKQNLTKWQSDSMKNIERGKMKVK